MIKCLKAWLTVFDRRIKELHPSPDKLAQENCIQESYKVIYVEEKVR